MTEQREAFERSARWWLRAYPARWRRFHEDEVLGLLEDLAPDGARRLDRRTAWDLARSGWATRWRTRPDPVSWVMYRFFDLPITSHADWVSDDIEGRWYYLRHVGLAWVFVAIAVVAAVRSPGAHTFWQYLGFVAIGAVPVVARPTRRRARKWHLMQDEPPPAGSIWGPSKPY
ncbi:hypothetical protein OEB99_13395 [Actinotalea sp. M2MS4P-6]|uniref:hypothetical protein n=1 Tax=Actinotalea sp. M2MS4P-6 TaxID=2983762 RepID=UPI0021E4F086|nr:hypothetical protein [Actinotalea sp. M2MS4P-6]MCV2395305.1 hypothetical protein [Actinotalea sp. M2MS4P-6]